MNKERRKEIARAAAMIEEAKSILETCRDEEQDYYYDNMPESFQNGDKGDVAQVAIDGLDEVISSLEDVVSSVNDVTSA
ncbi:hypothetical protein EOS93_25295 [Rhizobium sp. RMa-01]|uniref:hypothetical protein n=1 Tax=unclassified Rhizobium TaxID=2613769 RepID=UPI0008D9E12E|nr:MULTISPECIES: hypothetical protein [unclassified Rhizobium]OHV24925.1 hypothetical protein BBJ66_22540 [Rhizobium sp. RSm-3]RVU08367.1 hypothetical protein EOS93_25295 [Rhizobium sp. RMa-01]